MHSTSRVDTCRQVAFFSGRCQSDSHNIPMKYFLVFSYWYLKLNYFLLQLCITTYCGTIRKHLYQVSASLLVSLLLVFLLSVLLLFIANYVVIDVKGLMTSLSPKLLAKIFAFFVVRKSIFLVQALYIQFVRRKLMLF